MEPIQANIDWYSSLSFQKSISPRCPYANVDRCPRYYESLSLLGNAGITTKIQTSEEKRLMKKWKKSELWPKTDEHAASIWGHRDSKNFHNFCPEVAYDVFGLFASELHCYADDIDIHAAHAKLAKNRVSANDWRWQWTHITPFHYSDCRLYSQLLSTKVGGTDNINPKEIFEVKPSLYGITVNIKEIVKRIWKLICSHSQG